jgi:hypothetical protein
MALVTAAELATALGMPAATDPRLTEAADAADTWLIQYLRATDADGNPIDHDQHSYDRQAALTVAVEIWQSATAAGGQSVAADFSPAPYQTGAPLLRRVSGLIAPCRATQGMVG